MRGFFYAFLVICTLGLTAALAAPVFLKPKDLETRAIEALELALGREITVTGKITTEVFPSLGVTIEGLEIGNAPGFSAPYLARTARAHVRLKLSSLMQGKADVAELTLLAPDIRLEQREGTNNWTFSSPSGVMKRARALTTDLHLLKISKARLSYQVGSNRQVVSDVTLSWSGVTTKGQSRLDATGRYLNANYRLNLWFGEGNRRGRPMKLSLLGQGARFRFNGLLNDAATSRFAGRAQFEADSLNALTQLMGGKPGAPLAGAIVFDGPITGERGVIGLHQAAISLGDVPMKASLKFEPGLGATRRPRLSGTVHMGAFDLTPYAPAGTAPAIAGRDDVPPGWPTDTLDWSAFAGMDWAVTLHAREGLTLHRLNIGSTRVHIHGDGQRLLVQGDSTDLYGGQGSARLSVALKNQPDVSLHVDARGADAPRLLAAYGYTKVEEGKINLSLDVAGRGDSQAAIISTLNGHGQFSLSDATIKGPAYLRLARKATQIFKRRQVDEIEGGKTRFDTASAHWTMANGVVTCPDLRLTTRDFNLSGDAEISLPKQTLVAHVVLKPEPGPPLPFRISGPWGRTKMKLEVGLMGVAATRGTFNKALDWVEGLLPQ